MGLLNGVGGFFELFFLVPKLCFNAINLSYGVDIDSQAVEVTKLSLLLKVLEDEQSVISQRVEIMLTLNKKLKTNLDSHNRTVFKRQIEATDQQIDQLVYQLYGLTAEEIELVENG
jgi:Tfp pilus assembly PilM family ATPase